MDIEAIKERVKKEFALECDRGIGYLSPELVAVDKNDQEIRLYIKFFCNGELEGKIKRAKSRVDRGIPREYYDTRTGYYYSNVKVATSGYSDPTADKVIKLVDYELSLKYKLSFLQDLKMLLGKFIKGLTTDEKLIFKASFTGGLTGLKVGCNKYEREKKAEELERMAIDRVKGIYEEFLEKY